MRVPKKEGERPLLNMYPKVNGGNSNYKHKSHYDEQWNRYQGIFN